MYALIFGLLSTAEANPATGMRVGLCAGAASNCQSAQARLGFHSEKFGLTLGVGPVIAGGLGAQYYFAPAESNQRTFIGLGVGFAMPSLLILFNGFEWAGLGMGLGPYFGSDFHLLKSRKLIVTPRVGLDYGSYLYDSNNGYGGVHPSASIELTMDLF